MLLSNFPAPKPKTTENTGFSTLIKTAILSTSTKLAHVVVVGVSISTAISHSVVIVSVGLPDKVTPTSVNNIHILSSSNFSHRKAPGLLPASAQFLPYFMGIS